MNCRTVQPLLSEYIDNTLSARETWEVDRHLAECNSCNRALNEMRRTVGLVASSPRFEVSDDFMASLQVRLAGVEPSPARWAWLEGLRDLFRPRALPAWGALGALGTAALAFVMLVPRGPQIPAAKLGVPVAEPAIVQSAARQNLALQAADPFADIAAANLSAHVSTDLASDTESIN